MYIRQSTVNTNLCITNQTQSHTAQRVIGYSVVIENSMDNNFWQLSKMLQLVTVEI